MTRLLQPLRRKLPLLITALLCVVVMAVCWSAYRRAQGALLDATGIRLTGAAQQLAAALDPAARRLRLETRRMASAPVIGRFLEVRTPSAQQAARKVLEDAAAGTPQVVSFSIWDAAHARALFVAAPSEPNPPRLGALPIRPVDADPTASSWVAPLVRAEGRVVYAVVAPVLSSGKDTLGFLVSVRQLLSGPGAERLAGLIGSGASVLLGNAAGDVWTDLSKAVPGPPRRMPIGTVGRYTSRDGEEWVGVPMRVGSTPWQILVQMPLRVALLPAKELVWDVLKFALLFVAIGGAAAWLLSRRVTGPLVDLASAAEGIARGDYSRRVDETRGDEFGRVARAFNSMAEQVEVATDALSGRAAALETANQELRESETRYRQLVEFLPDGVLVHRDQRILMANRAVTALAGGAKPSDLIGRSLLDLAPADERQETADRARRVQEERVPAPIVEQRFQRLAGAVLSVETTSTPITFDGHTAVLTIIRDVSERKRLETQFRQAQKMEAVGQLAGGVAHDFNNLLTAIKGYGRFLLDSLDPGDERREDVAQIDRAADRATSLTRQLLAFSRQQVLQPRVLDLNHTVVGLQDMLRRLIPADIRIVTRLGSSGYLVYTDPGQLEQVLVNLVVNARDAMPDGGTLTIETADAEPGDPGLARHAGRSAKPHVILAVSDTGVGMDREVQERIFEPFFTTKPSGKGTGLGLSTVYGIVKQSSGYISVYSEPGSGTTFRIYLPRAQGDVAVPEEIRAELVPPVYDQVLLLVEDEEAVRGVAARTLRNAGYVVIEAGTGADALRILERGEPIDLLLTDVVMPEMTGPDLVIRARALRPNVSVLFMSGYAQEAVRQRVAGASSLAVLEKPFTPELILRRVREALDHVPEPV